MATFGTTTEAVPEDLLALGYPMMCEAAIGRLMDQLNRTEFAPVSLLEDQRDGEALSVRLVFHWNPARMGLSLKADDPWWELLEVVPYDRELYPTIERRSSAR